MVKQFNSLLEGTQESTRVQQCGHFMDKAGLALVLASLMVGCAPTQSYIGKTKAELIAGRGLADQRQEDGDAELWQYQECRSKGALIGNAVVTKQRCYNTIYTIKDDVVVSGTVVRTR